MILRTDVEMLRQGTVQPAAVIHLSAIGVFDEQRNPAYAKALMEFIVSELKIPDTRSVGTNRKPWYNASSYKIAKSYETCIECSGGRWSSGQTSQRYYIYPMVAPPSGGSNI